MKLCQKTSKNIESVESAKKGDMTRICAMKTGRNYLNRASAGGRPDGYGGRVTDAGSPSRFSETPF
jgi:hypothetical protein